LPTPRCDTAPPTHAHPDQISATTSSRIDSSAEPTGCSPPPPPAPRSRKTQTTISCAFTGSSPKQRLRPRVHPLDHLRPFVLRAVHTRRDRITLHLVGRIRF